MVASPISEQHDGAENLNHDARSSFVPTDMDCSIYIVPTTHKENVDDNPEVDGVQEYCEEKSMKEIADISMTSGEDRFFNQISASDILKILKRDIQTRDTVKAIIAASKIPLEIGISQLITIELTKILRCAHEWSQTTAAKYLSETKQSDEMWYTIMISALTTAKDILEDAKTTSRAKSLRNLINRSIATSPTASCRAILNVFENSQAPAHIAALICNMR